MQYDIGSAMIEVVIVKHKESNKHKKPIEASKVVLKPNAKTITVKLSCKRRGTIQQAVTIKATVETDNLLVARIEAARAARNFGFSNDDMIEIDIQKHRC